MSDKMVDDLVIFAAGGTGGHIFPAAAVADRLKQKGYRTKLFTDKRYRDYDGKSPFDEIVFVSASSMSGGIVKKLIAMLLNLKGFIEALILLKKLKPKAVMGFGGYPSFPTMLAACVLKENTIIHEQNAVLGRVNKLIAKYVSKVALSFPNTIGSDKYPNCVFIGNPIRPNIMALKNANYPELSNDTNFHILITGGSQGAAIFSKVVTDAIINLPKNIRSRLRVDQQCRLEDIDSVRGVYKEFDINADLATFFKDIDVRLAAAHLVIARAGASTINELMVVARPSILIPFKYAMDNHQYYNAKYLEDNKAAIIIEEDNLDSIELADIIQNLFSDTDKLKVIAKNAGSMLDADPAESLSQLI